jgi:hypothetical protein
MSIKLSTISLKVDEFSPPFTKLPEQRINTQLLFSSPQTTLGYVFQEKQPTVEEIQRLVKCQFTGKGKPTDADLKKIEGCFAANGWTVELIEKLSSKNPEKGKGEMQDLFAYAVSPKT